jgi:hypothetical protein
MPSHHVSYFARREMCDSTHWRAPLVTFSLFHRKPAPSTTDGSRRSFGPSRIANSTQRRLPDRRSKRPWRDAAEARRLLFYSGAQGWPGTTAPETQVANSHRVRVEKHDCESVRRGEAREAFACTRASKRFGRDGQSRIEKGGHADSQQGVSPSPAERVDEPEVECWDGRHGCRHSELSDSRQIQAGGRTNTTSHCRSESSTLPGQASAASKMCRPTSREEGWWRGRHLRTGFSKSHGMTVWQAN